MSTITPQPVPRHLLRVVGVVCGILWLGSLTFRFYYFYWQRGPQITYPDLGVGMFSAPFGVNAYYAWAIGLHDTRGQRWAHEVMLLALAAVCLWVWLARPACGKVLNALLAGFGVAACVTLAFPPGQFAFLDGVLSPLGGIGWRCQLAGVLTAAAVACSGGVARRRAYRRLFAALTAAVWAALIVPGVWLKVDFSPYGWNTIEEMENHWAIVFGPADRLLDGLPLFESVVTRYGGLTTLAAVQWQRWFGPFDLSGYFRYICVLQGLYLAAALAGYRYVARSRWDLCLVAVVLAGCRSHFGQEFYCYPNHTAWRTIWFPVAVLVQILVAKKRLNVAAVALGVSSALGLAQNFETGVAVAAGHVTYLAVRLLPGWRERRWKPFALAAALFVAGVIVGISVYVLGCRLVLGDWPGAGHVHGVMSFLSVASRTGFAGGLVRASDFTVPLALLIYGHACYCLIATAVAPPRVDSPRLALRAGVAATILVWFAYYANRPHPEYLVSYLGLYGYLVIDLLRLLSASRRLARPWVPLGASYVLAGLVVLPLLAALCSQEFGNYRSGVELAAGARTYGPATRMAGVYVPDVPRAADIRKRARWLRATSPSDRPVFLTADCYLLPKLAGFWPRLSKGDVFAESLDRGQYDRLLREIVRGQASTVVFDVDSLSVRSISPNWEGDLHLRIAKARRLFFQQLRTDLEPYFRFESVQSGWEVWRRKGD